MAKKKPQKHTEEELEAELHERDVEGVVDLPAEEQDEVIDAAEHNPDPTTRRETIEQELMELRRSDAGSDLGD